MRNLKLLPTIIFFVLFILPIFPVRGYGVYTADIPCAGSWSLYSRYSLCGVVEFILRIFPVRGRGVYTPDIPCAGSWSLYSGYFLCRVVEFAP